MDNIRIRKNLERVVSRLPETKALLDEHQDLIAGRAEANLAPHRKTGEHKITKSKGTVDRFVNLEGPNALSLEVGHHHARTGEWVEGIGVLKHAI